MAIRIALVDDDLLILELLEKYLEELDAIQVVFTAQSGEQCLEKLLNDPENFPEIVLLDLKMEGMSGVDLLEHLKSDWRTVKPIVMSSHYKRSFMGFMLKNGAAAFIPKGLSMVQLTAVIHEVSEKGYAFLPEQMDVVRQQLSSKSPKPVLDNQLLSEREEEILRLICQQNTAEEIGEKLFITKRTVEGHKNNMYAKTGAKNQAGLIIYAVQNQLINTENIVFL